MKSETQDLREVIERMMAYIELKLERKIAGLEVLVDKNCRNLQFAKRRVEIARSDVVKLLDPKKADEGDRTFADDIRHYFNLVRSGVPVKEALTLPEHYEANLKARHPISSRSINTLQSRASPTISSRRQAAVKVEPKKDNHFHPMTPTKSE